MAQKLMITEEKRREIESYSLFYQLIDSDKDIDMCRTEFLARYPDLNEVFERLLEEEMR